MTDATLTTELPKGFSEYECVDTASIQPVMCADGRMMLTLKLGSLAAVALDLDSAEAVGNALIWAVRSMRLDSDKTVGSA